MPDESYLDENYFIDNTTYNCPFCKRRNVAYSVIGNQSFNWSDHKRCYVYFVKCHSCFKESMHLSETEIPLSAINHDTFYGTLSNRRRYFILENLEEKLDDLFFYSVPTSFFVLDNRVPEDLRNLLTEAEGSLKGNFLTGASACARKIVYEMTKDQNESDRYEDRIKALKRKHSDIDGAYFDTLLTIHEVTSSKVHENAYDRWESKHLRVILLSLKEAMHAIYIEPELRKDRRQAVLDLKEEVLGHVEKPHKGEMP